MKLPMLLFVPLLSVCCVSHAGEEISTVKFQMTLECPPSAERQAFERVIPSPDYQSPNQEAWILTTVNELEHLITLVQSGHFKNGNVNIGSDNFIDIDLENLSSVDLSLDLLCSDCAELETLSALQNKTKENLSYSDWSTQTLKALHDIQTLILKEKVGVVKSHRFESDSNNHQSSLTPLKEVKCTLNIKGPMSDELQALLDAALKANSQFKNHDDWMLATIHAIHKLEMLIHSGKINFASADVHVEELF